MDKKLELLSSIFITSVAINRYAHFRRKSSCACAPEMNLSSRQLTVIGVRSHGLKSAAYYILSRFTFSNSNQRMTIVLTKTSR